MIAAPPPPDRAQRESSTVHLKAILKPSSSRLFRFFSKVYSRRRSRSSLPTGFTRSVLTIVLCRTKIFNLGIPVKREKVKDKFSFDLICIINLMVYTKSNVRKHCFIYFIFAFYKLNLMIRLRSNNKIYCSVNNYLGATKEIDDNFILVSFFIVKSHSCPAIFFRSTSVRDRYELALTRNVQTAESRRRLSMLDVYFARDGPSISLKKNESTVSPEWKWDFISTHRRTPLSLSLLPPIGRSISRGLSRRDGETSLAARDRAYRFGNWSRIYRRLTRKRGVFLSFSFRYIRVLYLCPFESQSLDFDAQVPHMALSR